MYASAALEKNTTTNEAVNFEVCHREAEPQQIVRFVNYSGMKKCVLENKQLQFAKKNRKQNPEEHDPTWGKAKLWHMSSKQQ